MPYQSEQDPHRIVDEAALRAHFKPMHELAARKCIDHLDQFACEMIARSPFLCLATHDAAGSADVSPRGDPPGFVKVLDDRTLVIPDRPGNNRLDSLSNVLANPCVGMLFLIPGFDDTLRVNGRATLTTDPGLLSLMRVNDRLPTLAIVVQVDEVFLHCPKAFRRARLWDPASCQDRTAMPTLARMVLQQTDSTPSDPDELNRIDRSVEIENSEALY